MRMLPLLALALRLLAQTPDVRLVRVSASPPQPVHITDPGDGSGRLAVVEQAGRIWLVNSSDAQLLLDFSGRVACCEERGLLSIAFPPGYPQKPYFYIDYTAKTGDITISRLHLLANGAGDPASEQVLLTIPHRQFANHNGGLLLFGPDGYLYIGAGDGGGGGDTLGNGQNTNALLGKLLRIDVESGTQPYAIPPSNPFASRMGYRPEIWAYGLRNPWRFSFDRATGDLYIGDVGQDLYEEVDVQPAADPGGENYGWNIMEGLHCFQPGCNPSGLTLPVAEYPHTNGNCAIVGGFVYRGQRVPSLQGAYVYGDNCTGQIWTLRHAGGQWISQPLLQAGFPISTFGEDASGDLYVSDYGNGGFFRFESSSPAIAAAGVVNAASDEPGLAPGALATIFGFNLGPPDMTVAPGFPLTTELGGTQVLLNGTAVPLLAVAAGQINFQAPFALAPGSVTVQVIRDAHQSQVLQVDALPVQPGLFTLDGQNVAAPAHPGDVISLWATGLGAVAHPVETGAAAPDSPLSPTLAQPVLTIGGKSAAVLFSGLAPRWAGLYQLNIQVPTDAPAGSQDVVLSIAGRASRPAKLVVQ